MMTFEEILSRFKGVVGSGNSRKAMCPAHGDESPSLSVTLKGDRVLLHCFAGCSTEAVCAAAGLDVKDLFLKEHTQEGAQVARLGLTVDEYCKAKAFDAARARAEWGLEDGTSTAKGVSYPVVKIPYWGADGKFIKHKLRQSMGKSKSFPKFMFGVSCLYGLWRQQGRDGIMLVEGESDCHALWSAGIPALGLPGASQYNPARDDAVLAQYKRPCVHIERDSGGVALFHALTKGTGKNPPCGCLGSLLFCSLEGYKDPSEAWCALHDRPEEFRALMERTMAAAVPYDRFDIASIAASGSGSGGAGKSGGAVPSARADGRAQSSPLNGMKGGRPKADYLGAADSFFRQFSAVGRLLCVRGLWFRYDGARYVRLLDSDLEGHAAQFLQQSFRNGNPFNMDASKNALANVIMNLKTPDYCLLPFVGFERNMWLCGQPSGGGSVDSVRSADAEWFMSCKNGILDIRKAAGMLTDGAAEGEILAACLAPHTHLFFTRETVGYEFRPSAECPKWEGFLHEAVPDAQWREVVRMMFGYCLSPDNSQQVAFVIHGAGGTGKTVVLNVLAAMAGRGNYGTLGFDEMADKFKVHELAEKRLNITDEAETEIRDINASMELIKKITGGFGTVQSERKGKDSYMAETRARLVIAANALPPFSDASNAIFRRLVLIGMDVNFSERQDVNRNLSAEIVAAEMSGILNWALRGLAMVQRGNDPFGLAIVKERRAEYRQEADCVHRFVKENIVKDDACEILLGALYTRVFRPYLDDLGAARRGRSKLQKAIEELTRARYVMIRTATGKRPEVMRGCRYIGDYAEWPINHPVGIDDDADVSAALDGVPF